MERKAFEDEPPEGNLFEYSRLQAGKRDNRPPVKAVVLILIDTHSKIGEMQIFHKQRKIAGADHDEERSAKHGYGPPMPAGQ